MLSYLNPNLAPQRLDAAKPCLGTGMLEVLVIDCVSELKGQSLTGAFLVIPGRVLVQLYSGAPLRLLVANVVQRALLPG